MSTIFGIEKGIPWLAHSVITATATSLQKEWGKWNSVLIDFLITAGSGTWTIGVWGSTESAGTLTCLYTKTGLTASTKFLAPAQANYVTIIATEVVNGATVTIWAIPINDMGAGADLISGLDLLLAQLQGDGSGYAPVSLATSLSSEYDSIAVAKMSKGGVVIAHNAITATNTSAEINCQGHNTLSVECAVSAITSGNWVIEVLGCAITGGTFGRVYDFNGNEMHVGELNTDLTCKTPGIGTNETITFTFKSVPNYTKIRATRTTDGTLTCKVTPMNA